MRFGKSMPVTCQTHDLWKALMKYKQFQVGHSIKFLMVSLHCLESGWLPNRILIPYGRKFQIELCCIYELRNGAGYKHVCVLRVCVGYIRPGNLTSRPDGIQDSLDSNPSFNYRIWAVNPSHLLFPPQPVWGYWSCPPHQCVEARTTGNTHWVSTS